MLFATLHFLSHEPDLLLQARSKNIRKNTPTLCGLQASLYRPLAWSCQVSSKASKLVKLKRTCPSDKGKAWLHLKHLQKLVGSRTTIVQHSKHSQTQKTQDPAQTGHLLQNLCQINIGSCVLLWNTPKTLHTSYLNYPGPCLATVCLV